MDVASVGQWVGLMLAPTLAIGAALRLPRGVRAVRRWAHRCDRETSWHPTRPPIEQVAADLRRLLERHDALKQQTDVAVRARKLHAIEAALTDCAIEAALALELPCPQRPGHAGLPTPQLRRLLHALAGAGLVVQPLTGVFAAEDGS